MTETEMDGTDSMDPRVLGAALAIVGGMLVALGTMALVVGLPTPGGRVYGSRGQDILLMLMAGGLFILAALPNLRGGGRRAQKP